MTAVLLVEGLSQRRVERSREGVPPPRPGLPGRTELEPGANRRVAEHV